VNAMSVLAAAQFHGDSEDGAVQSKTSLRVRGVGLGLFTGFKCHKTEPGHGPQVELSVGSINFAYFVT
jgi:hypothetical protein